MRESRWAIFALFGCALAGCGNATSGGGGDAGVTPSEVSTTSDVGAAITDVSMLPDVFVPPNDVGPPPVDVTAPPVDVTAPPVDAGTARVDAGTTRVDVTAPLDAGTALVDSGPAPVDRPPVVDAGAPVDTGAPADPCARYTACGTCTPVDGCGWCAATGRCVSGTAAGPRAGTCGGRWMWLPSECDAPPPVDAGAPTTGCPNERPITFNTVVRGTTTASGWNESLTSWFARSDVACAPSTQSAQTAGPYQVYSLPIPPRSDWEIYLEPDPGVDVNLAGVWMQGATSTACAPQAGHSVVTCESSLRGAAGVAERVRLNATTNGYRVTILVNTPVGGTRGGFSLIARPWGSGGALDGGTASDAGVDAGASGCPGERPLAFNTDVTGSTAAGGWSASLTSWFARSDVACSPATFASQTNGPYQVYTIDMPPRSDWSVILTPAPGVNANLAAVWQQSATDSSCLPLVNRAVTAACEYSTSAGAGAVERVRLNAASVGYRVTILVNTPTGATPGAFTLRVQNYP